MSHATQTQLNDHARHSIPLHGAKFVDQSGEPIDDVDSAEDMIRQLFPIDGTASDFISAVKAVSTNPDGFPPDTHKLMDYALAAAVNMPGKAAAMLANSR